MAQNVSTDVYCGCQVSDGVKYKPSPLSSSAVMKPGKCLLICSWNVIKFIVSTLCCQAKWQRTNKLYYTEFISIVAYTETHRDQEVCLYQTSLCICTPLLCTHISGFCLHHGSERMKMGPPLSVRCSWGSPVWTSRRVRPWHRRAQRESPAPHTNTWQWRNTCCKRRDEKNTITM